MAKGGNLGSNYNSYYITFYSNYFAKSSVAILSCCCIRGRVGVL